MSSTLVNKIMRRLGWLILLCLLSNVVSATSLVGAFQLPNQTGVAGTLYLRPNSVASISVACGGPYLVVPNKEVKITVPATGVIPASTIVGNDCMTPTTVQYLVRFVDNNGNQLFSDTWTIFGTVQDIGTIVTSPPPVVALPNAVVTNPAGGGLQTILGPITVQGDFASTGNISSVNQSMTGTITSYAGVSTVSNGVPTLVAKADLVTQTANVNLTSLYTVPVLAAGFYRLTVYTELTRAATSSSTLPNGQVQFTGADSNSVGNPQFGSTSSANSLATIGGGTIIINAKSASIISYGTTGYATSGATPMQFAVHAKLEYLGN